RLDEYGANALPRDEGIDWVQLIWGQFNDPLIGLLIVAAVISAGLGEYIDFIVIAIIVVLNAALGIYQEFQAEQALAALSAMQVPQVSVKRGGTVTKVSAEDLVPGDLVLLEEGDSIPADGRLIEASSMRTMEAALTGESLPVSKKIDAIPEDKVAVGDRKNMVFMGTAVNSGRGAMIVTDTGLKTELGEIADLLTKVETGETPLQRRLGQLGNTLFIGAIIVVVIVFLVGVFIQGIPLQEMFLIAVSLAVAAVPEGLPALVTIGLSLGAGRMVERNALIRRLPAVETLGSVTVICSDKTGTLTKNEMTATFLALPRHHDVDVTGIGYTPEGEFHDEIDDSKIDPMEDKSLARLLKAMALNTNAYVEKKGDIYNVVGDTTEGALIVAAQKVGWTREKLEEDIPRINEYPFSSERKAMTTAHQVIGDEAQELFDTNQYITITKGAPDKLIGWASYEVVPDGVIDLADERRQEWFNHVDMMAKQGLRVLGVAYRTYDDAPKGELDDNVERDLILIGLVGIVDPARPEAKTAVQTARSAGIKSYMITGDHALTAEAIARDLGILNEGEKAITGNELDEMSDEEIKNALDNTSAFARVSPTHKLKLVKLLQEKGNIAAMTGDGVNDAPALKQADIGVAMGITGTDVSKGASEMVLTDDNFASIVAAIEEGRAIYDNIKKFIKYLLSSNVGEILVMFVALLVGMPVPLLAVQILWINLVTDGLPAIALGFEPAEDGVMQRQPRAKDESVFAGGIGRHIIVIGILIAILTLGGYLWGYNNIGVNVFNPEQSVAEMTSEDLVTLLSDYGFSEERIIEELPTQDAVAWDELGTEDSLNLLEGECECIEL
ncbi:MAG: cation-translocating P-type ATPase, partial [Chloroflexota bacterium]